jgi:hypothetical protein
VALFDAYAKAVTRLMLGLLGAFPLLTIRAPAKEKTVNAAAAALELLSRVSRGISYGKILPRTHNLPNTAVVLRFCELLRPSRYDQCWSAEAT